MNPNTTFSQTEVDAELDAEYGFVTEEKAKKFTKIAYQKLEPALRELKKFAGPKAEAFLGLTPIGQVLGLG